MKIWDREGRPALRRNFVPCYNLLQINDAIVLCFLTGSQAAAATPLTAITATCTYLGPPLHVVTSTTKTCWCWLQCMIQCMIQCVGAGGSGASYEPFHRLCSGIFDPSHGITTTTQACVSQFLSCAKALHCSGSVKCPPNLPRTMCGSYILQLCMERVDHLYSN